MKIANLLLLFVLFYTSCREKEDPSIIAGKVSVGDYFNYPDTGVQSAGIKNDPRSYSRRRFQGLDETIRQ